MHNYTKTLALGLTLAKRGGCYCIYATAAALAADDRAESLNLDRINAGEEVFNRVTSGNWVFCARKLSDALAFVNHA